MTRKKFVHKLWSVTLEFYRRNPESYLKHGGVGQALKHNRDFAKNVPVKFGSYQKAWDEVARIFKL